MRALTSRQRAPSPRAYWKFTFLILAWIRLASPLQAGTFFVSNSNDSGPGSLREAFLQAQSDGEDSTIVLNVAGPILVGFSTGLPLPDPSDPFSLTIIGNSAIVDGSALLVPGSGFTFSQGSLFVEGVTITNFTLHGIALYGNIVAGTIRGSLLENNQGSGIYIQGGNVRNLTISANIFRHNHDDGVTILSSAHDHRIIGNQFIGNFTNGIKIASNSYSNVVSDNRIQGNFQSGVLLTQGAVTNTIGPGNQIIQNELDGVQIDGVDTRNNVIVGNSISANNRDGISASLQTSQILVQGNTISSNRVAGIEMTNGVNNADFYGNTVFGHGLVGGVLIEDGSSIRLGAADLGNTIRNNWLGIVIRRNSQNVEIRGNQIYSNSAYGVVIGGNAQNIGILDGNEIFNHTTYIVGPVLSSGVRVTGGQGIVLRGSRVRDNFLGIYVSGGSDFFADNITVENQQCTGLWIQNMVPPFQVQNSQFRFNGLYSFPDPTILPHFCSGVYHQSSNLLTFGPNNEVAGHVTGVNATGSLSSLAAIQIANNSGVGFTQNGSAIYLELATGNILNNRIASNLGGIPGGVVNIVGSDVGLSGNQFANHSVPDLFVTLYDANPMDMSLNDTRDAQVSVMNNTFTNNFGEAAVLFEEARAVNLTDLATSAGNSDQAGNTYSNVRNRFRQRWFGLIEPVDTGGNPVLNSNCGWIEQGLNGSSNSRDLCPGIPFDDPLGRGIFFPYDYRLWAKVDQVLISGDGTAILRFLNNPQTVYAFSGGSTGTASYSWDGNTSNDFASASTRPGFNQGNHYQVARVVLRNPSSIIFVSGALFVDGSVIPVSYITIGENTGVFVTDQDIVNLSSVTAEVENLNRGGRFTITLNRIVDSQGEVVGFGGLFRVTDVPPANPPNLYGIQGDQVIARFWDPTDPSSPLTYVVAPVVRRFPSTLDLLDPLTQSPLAKDQSTPPQVRVIIGGPLLIQLTDPDQNLNSALTETYPNLLRIDNTRTGEGELLTVTETTSSSGIFRGTLPTTTVSSPPHDGIIGVQPGDRLLISYLDPDDPADQSHLAVLIVLPPASATLCLQDVYLPSCVSQILADQVAQYVLMDQNRNNDPNFADTIVATIPASGNPHQQMDEAGMGVASYGPSGALIDWEIVGSYNPIVTAYILRETGPNTSTFIAKIFTSSLFGTQFLDRILYVVPGGKVQAFYVDKADPNFPPEKIVLDLFVTTATQGAITYTDRFQHPRRYLYFSPQGFTEQGVLIHVPARNLDPVKAEDLPLSALYLEGTSDLNDLIRFDTPPSPKETSSSSSNFYISVGVFPSQVVSQGDRNFNVRLGEIVQARYRDPDNPDLYFNTTAKLCKNVPAVLELRHEDDTRLEFPFPGERIKILIFDEDENQDWGQREVLQTQLTTLRSQDSERLNLVETEPSSGVFSGLILLNDEGDAVPQDGRLRASGGEVITITYQDRSFLSDDAQDCPTSDSIVKSLMVGSPLRLSNLYFLDPSGNPTEYLDPASPVRVRLVAPHRNADLFLPESVTAEVFPDPLLLGRPQGEFQFLTLEETGVDTGVFETSVPESMIQRLSLGSWLSARYENPFDERDRVVTSAALLGMPLIVTITVTPDHGSIGDAVGVSLKVYNPNPLPTVPAELLLSPFRSLRPVKNHYFYRGEARSFPQPRSPLTVPLGTIAPRSSEELKWADIGPPRAKRSKDHMWAEVWANSLRLSPRKGVTFTVEDEPIFARATVLVQVFEDRNGNGFKDEDERGIPQVRVVSASGYSLYTDTYGRGHFADLPPGPERFKVDPQTLPQPISFSTGDRVDLDLKPGVLYQVSFGIVPQVEKLLLSAEKLPWRVLTVKLDRFEIPVEGDLSQNRLKIMGAKIPLYTPAVTFTGIRDPTALYASELTTRGGVDVALDPGGDPQKVTTATLELNSPEGKLLAVLWQGKTTPPRKLFLKAQSLLPWLKPEVRYTLVLRIHTPHGQWSSPPYRFWFLRKPPLTHIQSAGYYGFNESGLDPKTILLLSQAADLLRRYPHATVVIEGYTDDVGTPQHNLMLSQRRAEKAKEYLVLVEGISQDRIVARGRGATNFLYPNDTEEHRALNRRVEVYVSGIPLEEEARARPQVRVAGRTLDLPQEGLFSTFVPLSSLTDTVTLVFPSGVEYAFPLSFPEFSFRFPKELWVFGPQFTAPVDLEAPKGTRIFYENQEYLVESSPFRFYLFPYGRSATDFTLEFPQGLVIRARALIFLEESTQPPPGQESLEPHTFLTLLVPPEGTRLYPGFFEIHGEVPEGTEVSLSGEPVSTQSGRFLVRIPVSDTQESLSLDLKAHHPLGLDARFSRTYSVETQEFFGVGFIQHRSTLFRSREGEDFSQRWSHTGVAKLYLEDRFPQGFLKLRLRTPEEEWQLFPRRLTDLEDRRLSIVDPHRTYPTYGDGSTTVEELPGAFFLAMDLEYSQQRWEIGTLERKNSYSLLNAGNQRFTGSRLHLTTQPFLKGNTFSTDLDLIGSYEESIFTVDRLVSTGGLVYRLHEAPVVEGSEVIVVEELDPLTGIRSQVRELVYGKDYTIDYLSGTIWLYTPLELAGGSSTVIRDGTLSDRRKFLVVSYRYRPSFKLSEWGHGETLVQRISERAQIGVSYDEAVVEGRTRSGLSWFEYTPTAGTDIHFEYGRRWGVQRRYGESEDGGIHYWITGDTLEPPANAFLLTARTTAGPFRFDLYGRNLEAGYQGFRYALAGDERSGGVGLGWGITEGVTAQVRGDYQRIEALSRSHSQWLQVQYPVGDLKVINEARLRTGIEPRHFQRGDLGLGLRYPLTSRLDLYGDHQHEVYSRNEDSRRFYRTTLGSQYNFATGWGGFVEGTRALGLYGGRLGARVFGERGDGSLSYGIERDLFERRNYGILGVQGGYSLTPSVRIQGGQEIRHAQREVGYATLLGSEYRPISRLTLGIEGERGEFPQDRLSWRRSALRGKAQGEIPEISGVIPLPFRIGLIAGIRWQEGVTNSTGRSLEAEIRSPWERSFSVRFGYRYARDDNKRREEIQAFYQEFYGGGAYRPLFSDRLAVLFMLRYARELLLPRFDPTRTEVYAVIASLDSIYRLTRTVEVGGKVSSKRSGIKWEGLMSDPAYTYLFILHTALIFYNPFDFAGEYRFFLQPSSRTFLHGPALEVGARPSTWIRFALGYQFVGFEDELRPHDRFDAEGIYLKIAGEL